MKELREVLAENLPRHFLDLYRFPPTELPSRHRLLDAADNIIKRVQEAGYMIESIDAGAVMNTAMKNILVTWQKNKLVWVAVDLDRPGCCAVNTNKRRMWRELRDAQDVWDLRNGRRFSVR